MPGRVTLFLLDHLGGAAMWEIEEAVFPGDIGDTSLLRTACAELEAQGQIEVTALHYPLRYEGQPYEGGASLDTFGYRLTANTWLKFERAVQDVERGAEAKS